MVISAVIKARAFIPVALAGAMVLAGCSSEPGPVPISSLSSALAAPSEDSAVTFDAQATCETYFQLDLLRSTVAVGVKDVGKKERRALLVEYQQLLSDLVGTAGDAVNSGELPQQVLTNAEKMQRILDKFGKRDGIDSLSKRQKKLLTLQANRVEARCATAGYALPQENIDARELIP
ncbi:MAG: hypothetical protein O2943_01620 [Actinomycetota bacterium]|nr:hypothetical protein [Actinomycetota bacterium]